MCEQLGLLLDEANEWDLSHDALLQVRADNTGVLECCEDKDYRVKAKETSHLQILYVWELGYFYICPAFKYVYVEDNDLIVFFTKDTQHNWINNGVTSLFH